MDIDGKTKDNRLRWFENVEKRNNVDIVEKNVGKSGKG